ncbi:unnamed protein product [Rhizophagus irregularis]|nr:unnamed protein product [Rhizophagus irregularis]
MVKIWQNFEKWWEENYCIQTTVRIGNYFPVLFLIILVGWSYYAFVFRLCILFLLNSFPGQGVIYLLVYHILFILMMWSYFKATFTSPGSPTETRKISNLADSTSSTYIPLDQRRSDSGEIASNNSQEQQDDSQQRRQTKNLVVLNENGDPISLGYIMVKQNGERRFCNKCDIDKPDRTHHCRVCKKCISKMDHHCPWLNNCIGHRNQKYFYLFLIWATLYSFFISLTTLIPVIKYAQSTSEPVIEIDLNWTFLILLGGVFSLCLVGFTLFHTNLILSNQTTLESLQKHNYKIKEDGDVTTSKYLNLFDVGKKNNWIQVMGPKWYFWFIPIGNSFGDGKSWPLNSYRYSTLCDSVENLNDPTQIV